MRGSGALSPPGAGSSPGSLSVHEARRRSVRRVNEKEPADGAGGATAMAMNEIRQQARKSAAERVARLRQERADLVKRREELSARVMTALAERDAVIADAERRAGASLKELASSGLSLAEAAQWCDLVGKDAARLVKLVAQPTDAEGASTAREDVSGDR